MHATALHTFADFGEIPSSPGRLMRRSMAHKSYLFGAPTVLRICQAGLSVAGNSSMLSGPSKTLSTGRST